MVTEAGHELSLSHRLYMRAAWPVHVRSTTDVTLDLGCVVRVGEAKTLECMGNWVPSVPPKEHPWRAAATMEDIGGVNVVSSMS